MAVEVYPQVPLVHEELEPGVMLDRAGNLLAAMQRRRSVREFSDRPVPREVALVTDRRWEGNSCTSFAVFQDGDI